MHVRALATALVLAFSASVLQAATVGIRWKDQPSNPIREVTSVSSIHTVELWLELIPGEDASSYTEIFDMAVPDVSLVGFRALPTGWEAQGSTGPLGAADLEFKQGPTAAPVAGPVTQILGEFDLEIDAPLDGSIREITLSGHRNLQFPGAYPGLRFGDLGAGSSYYWDSRYNSGYSGYAAYGDYGNPGWSRVVFGDETGQPTPKPLILQLAPEPTSLLLLAFGGHALVRKRDRNLV
jgi:hypothetical protein